jgi:hypothetical protein
MITNLPLKRFDPSRCLIALGLRWIYAGLIWFNFLDVIMYLYACDKHVIIYCLFNFLLLLSHNVSYVTTSPPYWVVEHLATLDAVKL